MIIPYWHITSFILGPVRLQVWGLFVALGMAVAILLGRREAKLRGLDRDRFLDLAAVAVFSAVVGSRLGFALFYDLPQFIAEPIRLLYIWDGGMSLLGGFLGAGLAAYLFFRGRASEFSAYSDAAALYLPLGLAIGRLGCFFIHDHPGVRFGWFPAVDFPGGPRLDHGLLLVLVDLAIFAFFLVVRRLAKRGKFSIAGRFVAYGKEPFLALFLFAWGCVRFLLDFLRAWDWNPSDARLLWMTPAQYGAVAAITLGVWLLLARPRPSIWRRAVEFIRKRLKL